jgi:hypothetical protein
MIVSNCEQVDGICALFQMFMVECGYGTLIATVKIGSVFHPKGDKIMATSNIIKHFIFGIILMILAISLVYGLFQVAHKVDHTSLLRKTSQPLEPTMRSPNILGDSTTKTHR